MQGKNLFVKNYKNVASSCLQTKTKKAQKRYFCKKMTSKQHQQKINTQKSGIIKQSLT